jgi:hypothetical protein
VNPNQDVEHLRLLSIFHYVVAGMLALCSLIPIVHLTIGIAIVSGAFDEMGNGNAPPEFFGWFFIGIASIAILCGLATSLCMAVAGRYLGRHSGYMFCLVVAAIECMFMPLGTILGVFTILVLMRPTVKELFGVAEPE